MLFVALFVTADQDAEPNASLAVVLFAKLMEADDFPHRALCVSRGSCHRSRAADAGRNHARSLQSLSKTSMPRTDARIAKRECNLNLAGEPSHATVIAIQAMATGCGRKASGRLGPLFVLSPA